ncbi:hypothetical protein Scep_007891 [Stephania cephalantha]|uniref:Uncharacterized protein n=1 Tax=Stephania cephalantha TaxID=152367 RepID=A0AAP0KCM6_9MAGN
MAAHGDGDSGAAQRAATAIPAPEVARLLRRTPARRNGSSGGGGRTKAGRRECEDGDGGVSARQRSQR